MKSIKEINDFLAKSAFFYSISIGMDGKYSYVSPNYDRNFDFIGGSLLGKDFFLTLHPDDVKICSAVGAKCFEEPDSLFPATLRKHNGKGGFVITQWEMKAQLNDDNQPVGIFCIGYNITEHMDTKSRLADASLELSTREEQLNEIGFIQSHLVRKPLANIIGLSSIISNMETNENLKNINTMLADSTNELDEVIRAIVKRSERRGNGAGDNL
jgi:hypothetical protein